MRLVDSSGATCATVYSDLAYHTPIRVLLPSLPIEREAKEQAAHVAVKSDSV